jgi:ADP-ribose pyrophosphatase YjhB (NUDIX family)
MGLPGGHRQEEDSGDLQTALRETREEIGVDLRECGELLGSLDDVRAAASGRAIELIVSPFVYLVGASPNVEIGAEVAEVLWAPLSILSSGRQFVCHSVEFDGHNIVLPGWKIRERIVWGLTYRIVSDLLRLLVE